MTRFHIRPALAVTLLLTACLTPTDGSGRFGEARVRPQFSAGHAPDELGVAVDSTRTIIRRGADTLVDAVRPYAAAAAQAWIIELASIADDVDVRLELRVGQSVAYEGERTITVQEGTAGRADVEDVPVAYSATDIAARVEVVPDQVVFSALGHTR